MLVRTVSGFASGLSHLTAHLLISGHGHCSISISEEEAVLEELLHMGLGFRHLQEVALDCCHLLLHLVKLGHLGRDFCFPLPGFDLLLLDLCSGLATSC